MEALLLTAKIPYRVDFVRPRRRKRETTVLWDDGPVVVDSVSAAEAPVVYRITTTDKARRDTFSVRAFDHRLFWPVLRSDATETTLENFAEGISVGSTGLLRLLNPNISMGYVFPKMTETEFRREVPIREINLASRDVAWAKFRRGARGILIVESRVYVEGGEPLLFGFVDDAKDRLIFSVGPADLRGTYSSTDHVIPGPPPWIRHLAGRRGQVFGALATREILVANGTHRFTVDLVSSTESVAYGPQLEKSTEYCTFALFRHIEQMPDLNKSGALSAVETISSVLERQRLGHPVTAYELAEALESLRAETPTGSRWDGLSAERKIAERLLARLPSRSLSTADDEAITSLSI